MVEKIYSYYQLGQGHDLLLSKVCRRVEKWCNLMFVFWYMIWNCQNYLLVLEFLIVLKLTKCFDIFDGHTIVWMTVWPLWCRLVLQKSKTERLMWKDETLRLFDGSIKNVVYRRFRYAILKQNIHRYWNFQHLHK